MGWRQCVCNRLRTIFKVSSNSITSTEYRLQIDQSSYAGSSTIYSLDLSDNEPSWTRCAYGEENDPDALSMAGGDVTVFLQDGLEDQIRLVNGPKIWGRKQDLLAWDASFTTDSDEMIVAVAVGDVNHPPEVYTTTASGGADGESSRTTVPRWRENSSDRRSTSPAHPTTAR